ncbi:Protein of unknown function [Gryllus bimaculatus]|nr:Protein of unknown function [Gryllus bimaculatus]
MARVGLSPLSDRRAAAAAAAAVSASSDDELDDVSAAGRAGIVDPYTSDDTIDSCADKLVESEGELHRLRSRVADLETRVCEKDNELLEQQCTLLEMRNTYTARCMEAENQLSELLAHVRQVQADAEEERQSARNQVCALQVPLDVYSQENRILSEGTTNKQSINNVELDGLQAETISTRKTVESVEIESSDGGQQHMETVEEEDKEDELEITTEMQSAQGKQQVRSLT